MQQSHTFASRTSQHTDQSLQKSVPAQPKKEFQNIFPLLLKKIKTHDTQADNADSRHIQTRQLDD